MPPQIAQKIVDKTADKLGLSKIKQVPMIIIYSGGMLLFRERLPPSVLQAAIMGGVGMASAVVSTDAMINQVVPMVCSGTTTGKHPWSTTGAIGMESLYLGGVLGGVMAFAGMTG
jgi:hypothetical protein